jgi:hypothetical protein
MSRIFDDLWTRLAAIPDVEIAQPSEVVTAIDDAVEYLGSEEAIASLAEETYWPKWDGPWWHMVLLWELGEARRIPQRAVAAMVAGLNALPMHTFPIREEDWPPGLERARCASCHCALGTIDQVLDACGVDVDARLPWIAPWFPRYQMSDGGLNCDETAYLVTGECASSMVGTVAPFEAMLRRGPSEFLQRGAAFLVERELRLGSSSQHNADERDAEASWLDVTFPRFYFYDVLRGLTALVRWCESAPDPEDRTLPIAAIATAAQRLCAIAPDGIVRVGRRAFEAHGTWARGEHGWTRRQHAGSFALLDATSRIGAPSAQLTDEWRYTRHTLLSLI